MERRLAAILAADVVGYSRLMESDEAGTLAALKAHREELIDPTITDHHGRIVKLMGDGALVEFASVVDAVGCAAAIQRAAELASAITIVVASRAGIPVSTTHILVGSVLGVGLARGIGAIDLRVVSRIAVSWVATLPLAAGLSIFFYYFFKGLLSP